MRHTYPGPTSRSSSCLVFFEADSPLRALHDEVHRGLLARDLDESSFATEISSAVKKMAVRRFIYASRQRSLVIPTFSATATSAAKLAVFATARLLCLGLGEA